MQVLPPKTAPALEVGEICVFGSSLAVEGAEGGIQPIPVSALKATSYHHGLLHGSAFSALDLGLSGEKRWSGAWFAGSQASEWAWPRHSRGSSSQVSAQCSCQIISQFSDTAFSNFGWQNWAAVH